MTTLWKLNRKPRLLFVEEDIDIGGMLEIYFKDLAEVTLASQGLEALIQYPPDLFDLIILSLQGTDEDELIRLIQISGNKTPILLLTQKDGLSNKIQRLGINVYDYIIKPFDIEELRLRISHILNRLAGDPSTDAPLPDVKKKKRKGS